MTLTNQRLIEEIKGIRRVVINICHGGFSLSDQAIEKYRELTGITDEKFWDRDVSRDDPYLIQIINEMGEKANGSYAELKIVEIPADVDWIVEEYDGREWIAERHRTWD
jgi:hypothetical protein